VDEVGHFYKAQVQAKGTHLALRWNGRVRFTVSREAGGQQACWKVFNPGRLEFPLRAMVRLPRLLGSVSCVESEKLALIRNATGNEAGLSCGRAGTPGPWSKDTILLLNKKTAEPLYIVKAGVGEAVASLLRNEAYWLRTLRDRASLIDHIPELVAHRSGADLSFVAQSPLFGQLDLELGELHFAFLRKLQEHSRQTFRLEESRLYRNLRSRLQDISALLPEEWSTRLEKGMRRIEQSLSRGSVLFVDAHNDFTPWNIRVERGVARVFDWEYADSEQLPLFDPLHFALMPMALKSRTAVQMLQSMRETLQLCRQRLGEDMCCDGETQALAYLLNLCILYLWSEGGKTGSGRVLQSYTQLIDHICRI
jgi:hypothetical protein